MSEVFALVRAEESKTIILKTQQTEGLAMASKGGQDKKYSRQLSEDRFNEIIMSRWVMVYVL